MGVNYRKIWSDHFGPIPKDEQGRSYDIHHIDGNKNNNDITNLKAVSIEEHYQIHFDQGDWPACCMIASRLDLSKEEINKLRPHLGWPSMKVLKCPHCHKTGTKPNMIRWHFDKCPNYTKKVRVGPSQAIAICPHCKKSGGISTIKRYHFDACKKLTGESSEFLVCPHCNKNGHNVRSMKRYHFDNCPSFTGKKVCTEKVQCPHCKVIGGKSNMTRYHFNNCKKRSHSK